jgi:predicted Zn-dependent peptidase
MSRIATLVLAALAAAAPALAQTPDRSKAPVPGPAPALSLPPIVKRTLSNGLPVWILERHKVPLVHVTLLVKAGAAADPAGKAGLASVTADLLDEGAGGRSALDLADAVAVLGAPLGTAADWDDSTLTLQLPVAQLDAGLGLLSDVALRPAFDAAEFDRLKKTRLTAVRQRRDDPSTMANLAIYRVLYGLAHPYGTFSTGTESSLAGLTLEDVKACYGRIWQPGRSQLIVVGDVTADAVLPLLETRFGGWKGTAPAAVTPPPAPPAPSPRTIYLVDKPGAAQSQIRIGLVGVARRTPDYFTLDVVNTILGGSFTSRLNQNLREQHGYAYGASTSFAMRASAGPFVANAGVQTDKTTESLKEFFTELEAIRAPIPEAELVRGRNYEALSFPSQFETLRGVAAQLVELAVYDLPESFVTDYVPKIQAVTTDQAQAAARKYILPDKLAVVVVGYLAKIEAGIRAANFAPVQVLKVDDLVK